MYELHYGYIKAKYGEKAKLLYTDTDSFMYEMETEDFYKDISTDVENWFDISEYSEGHPSGIKTGISKVSGVMKDELGDKIMEDQSIILTRYLMVKTLKNVKAWKQHQWIRLHMTIIKNACLRVVNNGG